jgi:hypothetical protein
LAREEQARDQHLQSEDSKKENQVEKEITEFL